MKKVITISRQFGSAGRSIGKAVAEKLGYAYYDKEIIEKLAEQTGLSKSYIENTGEHAASTNLFSYAFVGRTIEGQSVEDYLWQKQRELILEIAEKDNCVIVGRCADYILKEREDALHVFIHADQAKRAKRIVELYGETKVNPEKRLMDKDKKRAVNYKYYTNHTWGMSENYHISLDSGVIGIDECIDIIFRLVNEL